MKAVVWTDVFQLLVFVSGLLFLVIKGVLVCGGLGYIFNIAYEKSRLELFRFSFITYSREHYAVLI